MKWMDTRRLASCDIGWFITNNLTFSISIVVYLLSQTKKTMTVRKDEKLHLRLVTTRQCRKSPEKYNVFNLPFNKYKSYFQFIISIFVRLLICPCGMKRDLVISDHFCSTIYNYHYVLYLISRHKIPCLVAIN